MPYSCDGKAEFSAAITLVHKWYTSYHLNFSDSDSYRFLSGKKKSQTFWYITYLFCLFAKHSVVAEYHEQIISSLIND